MNEDILISVIVPVYNGEQFVDRAVQSVLCQMDGTIELILVNDGSTDGSGKICDDYAAKHNNIRVIHKENGGLSSARNAGISAAAGDYLMFLDADDFLDTNACAEIEKVISKCQPDCIDFGWKYVSRTGETTPNHHKIKKNILLGVNILREVILPPLLNLRNDPDHFIFDFSCTKVFRRDITQNNCVMFDENRKVWEDKPFVVNYLKFCSTFYSMDQCFYNYVDMPGSLSRKYSMDFFRIIVENFHLYKKLYGEEYDFDTEYVNGYWCRAIENMIYRSLEQTELQTQIRENIMRTLANQLVIHWYSGREPQNTFERKISVLVVSGQCEKALRLYEQHRRAQLRTQRVNVFLRKVKNRIARK